MPISGHLVSLHRPDEPPGLRLGGGAVDVEEVADPLFPGRSRQTGILALGGASGDRSAPSARAGAPQASRPSDATLGAPLIGTRTASSMSDPVLGAPVSSRTPDASARTPLTPDQLSRVQAYLAARAPGAPQTLARTPSSRPSSATDPFAFMGLGATGLRAGGALLGGTAGEAAGDVGIALSAAASVHSMVAAIDAGDGARAASAAVGLTQAGLQGAKAMGLISATTLAKVAPWLSAAGLGLGLYTHDPGAIVSGAAGTVAGAAVAGGALGAGGAAVTGGLAALPAIAMWAGGDRAAAIDARRARATRAAMADFQAAPETRNLRSELIRLRSGDASQITAIARSFGLAVKVQYHSNGMDNGGLTLGKFFSQVSSAIPREHLAQFYGEVSKVTGWDPRTAAQQDSYQHLTSILGGPPGPPPVGWKAPPQQPGYSGGFPGVPTTAPVDPYAASRSAAPVPQMFGNQFYGTGGRSMGQFMGQGGGM